MTRPPQWAVLAKALTQHQPVRARYHGHERVLCPHALGWKHGRPKLLALQSSGTTTTAQPTHQRWRSMFIDEIENPKIINEPWQTASNYSQTSNCFDTIEQALEP